MFQIKNLWDVLNDEQNMELLQKLDKLICPTKTPAFNYMTEGYRTGNVWLVDEEMDVNKTQWSLGEAVNLANNGHKVLYISTNMDHVDIMHSVNGHLKKEAEGNFFVELLPRTTTTLIEWYVTMTKCCYEGFDVIFIDNIDPMLIETDVDYSDGEKAYLLLHCLRDIIRGEDLCYEPKEGEVRNYPCLVVLAQLSRKARNCIPDDSLLRGSYCAAIK